MPPTTQSVPSTQRNDAWDNSSLPQRGDVGGFPSDVQGPEPISLSIAIQPGTGSEKQARRLTAGGRNIVAVTAARFARLSHFRAFWDEMPAKSASNQADSNCVQKSSNL